MTDADKSRLGAQVKAVASFGLGYAVAAWGLPPQLADSLLGLGAVAVPMAIAWWDSRKAEAKLQEKVAEASNQPRETVFTEEQRSEITGNG